MTLERSSSRSSDLSSRAKRGISVASAVEGLGLFALITVMACARTATPAQATPPATPAPTAQAAATPAARQPQSTPPDPAPLRPWRFPEIREGTLANGMRLILVEKHTLPIVTARVMFDAGALREPAAKSGLAALTGNLLREGTPELGGAEISTRMERMGAQFGTVGTFSMSYIELTALPEVFPEALALAASTVTSPTFPESEFERVRAEMIADYHQTMARVEGIADRIFYQAAFRREAPYSRSSFGTEKTLSTITREDVMQWHRERYSPATATVLVVGAIDEAGARRVIEQAFAGWSAPARREPVPSNPATERTGTRIILVDRPGSVQSAILIGQQTPLPTSPDYIPLLATTHVLGGGFSSRLNMNLREQHGFTYGAFGGLDLRRGGSALTLSSSVRTSATDSALVEALREYRRIVQEPVPVEELRGFVNNLAASFPSSTQTVQELRTRLQNLELWGLPLDFYETYRERLTALTPSDIQAAARRHVTPDRALVVIAGDLSRIEDAIRGRNLGEVEIWDMEGNRIH